MLSWCWGDYGPAAVLEYFLVSYNGLLYEIYWLVNHSDNLYLKDGDWGREVFKKPFLKTFYIFFQNRNISLLILFL